MTRSASTAAIAAPPVSTAPASTPSASTRRQAVVRLGDLDIAPENLRHGEAADDDIPQLADTIAAAGLLQFPTVRPGRGDEAAYMVLDGRRRLLALWLLRDGGVIDDDHCVEVFVETDRKRQAAAVVLTNTAVPVHVADVVAAIGRMLKARLGVKAIARALGYGEIEIRRLAALSALPGVALEALKTGRITLRQARLLARLKDANAQAELAQAVLDGHGLQEWRIQEQLGEGRITNRDPRCGLVTPEHYAAEGGRTEADLFGELPAVLLDPQALTRAWLKRAAQVAAPLEAEGLTVHLSAGDPDSGDPGPDLPEDLEPLYYAYGGLSDEATLVYREARDRAQAAAEAVATVEPGGGDGAEYLEAFVRARIAQDQAGAGERLAVVLMLRPSLRTGVEVDCYGLIEAEADPATSADDEVDAAETATEAPGRPVARSAYAPPRAEAPAPEVEGVSHVLHATRTDMATRGLIRALADAPEVALTALVARLFGNMAVWPPVGRTEAALTITASVFSPSGGRIVETLDGAVRERLRELLADLDEAADVMLKTLHRPGADGEPEVHPFIQTAVKGYAAMHDRFRTSVQGTARSYLKWLAGDDVERVLSASDFAMGDLMCAEAPMSLFVQVAPADAAALRPLVRLLFHAAAQALTAEEKRDAAGRAKRHKLLMVMDEFPLLGRLAFFEKSLRLMSGYGIKAMFVAQSLNDIVETYGPHNTILDNCHVYTAFSALDPLTQEKVSRLTGSVTETRTSRSAPSGFGAGHGSVSRSEVERPLLEPGEIRALPDDRQLVFVAGQRPLRTEKLLYDRREPFRSRAGAVPPDQALRVDSPGRPPHPWRGRRSLGRDATASLPLFKEVAGAMDDRKAASRAADIYGRVAQEMAAQQAVLDQLQGGRDG